MCKFFSVVSDGEGQIKFFTPNDIFEVLAVGNPKSYDFNSHTSICQYHGINSKQEDRWNKWEYNPETGVLTRDELNTDDDSEIVKDKLKDWFKNKQIYFIKNFYEQRAVSGSRGVSDSKGVSYSSGVSYSRGVSDSSGVSHSSGVSYSSGVYRGIFCHKYEQKPILFNKEVSEKRWNEVNNKIYELWGDWFPEFNNAFKLYVKAGNDWSLVKANEICNTCKDGDPKEAWASMPKEAIKYIKSLPEFDAKIFEAVTGIK